MKKIQYWASAFIITASLISTACNKDDKTIDEPSEPEKPITEEPSTPEPQNPAPVIVEQHFWQQDSKEEIIVTETHKVETIEEVVEVVKAIETPTSIVVSEDFSEISVEEIEEKLSEVATVLAQNPEQAKKTVLDLSETKIKKLTADTFKAQLGLSKAGSDTKIYVLKLILPESVEEIASGACVDFSGTSFQISNVSIEIEQGAFDPQSGISFVLDPDLYADAGSLINILKSYGSVKIAWENILKNGLTLTNNSPSAQYTFPDTVKYSYLILDFEANSNQVSVYKGYTKTNGEAQLMMESTTQYHIQNNDDLSANILIDWGQGIDGRFFVSESDLYTATFAQIFSKSYGATFNTALWGAGVHIANSQNIYSPFVVMESFDAAKYQTIKNESEFVKHDELGIKTSVSDEIKKIASNGAFITTPTHTISIVPQYAYVRENKVYDSIEVNYIVANDYSKITLTIDANVLGTLYGSLENNKINYRFETADYYNKYLAYKDLESRIYNNDGIGIDNYYFRFLPRMMSISDYTTYDSIMVDYMTASDFSKVYITYNGFDYGTISAMPGKDKVDYTFAPTDFAIRLQALSKQGLEISDGQYIVRLLDDNTLSYRPVQIYDSVVVNYSISQDYSNIITDDGISISLSVKNQKIQYKIVNMRMSSKDLKAKIESNAWFEVEDYYFNFWQNQVWFTDKSNYDSILVDYEPDASYTMLTISYDRQPLGTLVPSYNGKEVCYTFKPDNFYLRYRDIENAKRRFASRKLAGTDYEIRFLGMDGMLSYMNSKTYDSTIVSYEITPGYTRIIIDELKTDVSVEVNSQKQVIYRPNSDAYMKQ